MPTLDILIPDRWEDYALLDSGNGRKLERFGAVTIIRPEQQAIWSPRLPGRDWDMAQAVFAYHGGDPETLTGKDAPKENWLKRGKIPPQWLMHYGKLSFVARLTPFRHVGVFPEQAVQWDWVSSLIAQAKRPVRVLNLFAYTGLASLAATAAGAQVVHLDASKPSIDWAKENQAASRLPTDSIRWIVDDALKFVRREVRRGAHYEGIIMDPPAFGRGTQGQTWQFHESLPLLLAECKQLLAPEPLFFLLTSYDIRASALMLDNTVRDLLSAWEGQVHTGEHVLRESSGSRLISTSIFARWQAQKF